MNIEDIKTVAVIGAGDMGHGIAETAAIGGYQVYLADVNQNVLENGLNRIYESLEKLVSKGIVSADHHNKIKSGLIASTTSIEEAVRKADLAIEAVPEDMTLKQKVFEAMDKSAPEHTLLASNTSTMRITEIASATQRPQNVFGLHYFNPVVLMKLVEVIRGDMTANETIQVGLDYVKRVGKVPVCVEKDIPGFIVNRAQAPSGVLLNCYLDEEIITPEEMDALLKSLGLPMGPYEIMDYTGLDIAVNAGNYFAEAVHPDFAPGRTIRSKVEAGELGKKTGKGFYDWSNGRPQIDISKATKKINPIDMLLVNLNEATKIVEMGACSLVDIDLAIVNATGSTKGPIEESQGIEPEFIVEKLNELANHYKKEIFKPTETIKTGGYLLK